MSAVDGSLVLMKGWGWRGSCQDSSALLSPFHPLWNGELCVSPGWINSQCRPHLVLSGPLSFYLAQQQDKEGHCTGACV